MDGVKEVLARRGTGLRQGQPPRPHTEVAPRTGGWRDEDIWPLPFPYRLPKAEQLANGWYPASLPGPACLRATHRQTEVSLKRSVNCLQARETCRIRAFRTGPGPREAETLPPSPGRSHFLASSPEIPASFKASGCSLPEHGVTSEVTGWTSRSILAGNLHVSGAGGVRVLDRGQRPGPFTALTPGEPESSGNRHLLNMRTRTQRVNLCLCRARWEVLANNYHLQFSQA